MSTIRFLLFLFFFANAAAAQPFQYDAKLHSILSPHYGNIPDCLNNDSIPVTVIYENIGTDTLFNLTVSYQLDSGTVYTDTIDFAATGLFHLYVFDSTLNLSGGGSHNLTVWLSHPLDMDPASDTISISFSFVPGTLQTLPVFEDFTGQPLCDTLADCGVTACTASLMWLNLVNGMEDGIDFRVHSGSTPTDSTGPDIDHTNGDSAGRYIYLESSNCVQEVALLQSNCFDLRTVPNAELRFWYHLYGSAMADSYIMVDIFSRGRWYLNMGTLLTGDQGNVWNEEVVDLSAFYGNIINIRIRAVLSADSAGTADIAIDDIIVAAQTPVPTANFGLTRIQGCPGSIVSLIDISSPSTTNWNWTITPSGYQYINGTDSLSQNPDLQFNAAGVYTITLEASNFMGVDTFTRVDALTIYQPSALPFTEDFETTLYPPAGWAHTPFFTFNWDTATVTGSNGLSTRAIFANNYWNSSTFPLGEISSHPIDLSSNCNPILTFDVAHMYTSPIMEDALRIEISTDCGGSFNQTGYYKIGQDLATVPNNNTAFFPTAASQWRRDTVQLSFWPTTNVILKFVDVTAYGNNVFIDNVALQCPVGMEKHDAHSFSVYPNPATDILNVVLNMATDIHSRLEMVDMQGRVIFSEDIASGRQNFTLDLSAYKPGIYLLRLQNETGQHAVRVVKN